MWRSRILHRGSLITISGMDGSGKSSHSQALEKSLAHQGLTVMRAWVGHKPILSFPFLALVRMLGCTHRRTIDGVPFYWRDWRRNPALARLWPLVLSLDFLPKAFWSVKIPVLRGKIVICDRYLYDMMAELSQYGLLGANAKRFLVGIVERPTVAFLMDVDTGLAWKRTLVPGRAREQPIYDLRKRREAFLRLASEFGMIVLDGGGDPERNRSEILNRTLDSLGLANSQRADG